MQIRAQFPIFSNHPELIYLDNAATTQKPDQVIRAVTRFYEEENTNINRGLYDLAAQVSQQHEVSRAKVANFIGAGHSGEIIFTSGATAGINLVAQSFLMPRLHAGDEVLVTVMEHHANLIPWQQACKRKKAKMVLAPVSAAGQLDLDRFREQVSPRTKMVALTHVSNAMGTINPVREIAEMAQEKGIPVLVDAAQSIAHFDLDVADLNVDFLVFSGHKMFAPTGIGVLYAKKERLLEMQPSSFGGGAVRDVRLNETVFADSPRSFEPGTPNLAGVAGLAAAIDFINLQNKNEVSSHLKTLTNYATQELKSIDNLNIIGPGSEKGPIISLTVKNVHPHDLATFLAAEGIAVRAGNHCAQPLMDFMKIPGTTRLSFALYNTTDEVDKLVQAVREAERFFNG